MRLRRLKPPGLVLLALAPLLFVTTLYIARTGRDLTTAFLVGLAVFGLVGVVLLGYGVWTGHAGRVHAGIVILLSLLCSLAMGGTITYWVGFRETDLIIHVRDADSGQEIDGATVEVSAYRGEPSKGRTDSAGTAHVRRTFMTFGATSLVVQTGEIECFDELAVSAAGYRRIRGPLWKHMSGSLDLYGPPLPVVEVALKKATP